MYSIMLTDRTGLLGVPAGLLAELPHAAIFGYMTARILIPALLIALAMQGATPLQRIDLVRDCIVRRSPRRQPHRRRLSPPTARRSQGAANSS